MSEISYKELYEKVQGKLNAMYAEISKELNELSKYINELSPRQIIFDKAKVLYDAERFHDRLLGIIDSCNAHNITDGDRDKIKEMWEFYKMFRKNVKSYMHKELMGQLEQLEDGRIKIHFQYHVFAEDYKNFIEKYKEE